MRNQIFTETLKIATKHKNGNGPYFVGYFSVHCYLIYYDANSYPERFST